LTELEDRLGIIIDDEDVDGDMLGDLGGLVSFAVRKVNG
jgi:acyl carrier protein